MAQYFTVHPDNPQHRLLRQAAEIVRHGGLIAYPTDSSFALGCHLDDKSAVDRIRRIRQLDRHHNFTLVASEVSQLSQFAKINNQQFRLLKTLTPGPYTFIFAAKRAVPNRLVHPKRKTIGVRLPANPIARGLIDALGEPIMSSSLILPNQVTAMSDAEQIRLTLQHKVDLVIDGGVITDQPSTVIDWHGDDLVIVRHGAGDVSFLEQ